MPEQKPAAPEIKFVKPGDSPDKGCVLPDELLKLYFLAIACVELLATFRDGEHITALEEMGYRWAIDDYGEDLRRMAIARNEGMRLLRRFRYDLTAAAGGAVSICGEDAPNAHDLVFKLVGAIGQEITQKLDLEASLKHGWVTGPDSPALGSHLNEITEDTFREQYARMGERIAFLDPRDLRRLTAHIRREYILAKPRLEKVGEHVSDKPEWSTGRRELRFQGNLCKRFRQRAPNQTAILDAFQEAAWPDKIDDPLRPSPEADNRQRLADAVRALNTSFFIRFELDGTGEGIVWKVADDEQAP